MWNKVKLCEVLKQYRKEIWVQDEILYKQLSITKKEGIKQRGFKIGSEIGRKRQFIVDLENYPKTILFTRQTIQQDKAIGLAPIEVNNAIVTENMPTLQVLDNVLPEFLLHFFKSDIFFKQLDSIAALGSAQQAIHERQFLDFEIILPPISEQLTIVEKLENATAKLKQLKQLRAESLKETEMLKSGFIDKILNNETLFTKSDKLKNVVNENNKTALATDFPEMIYLSLEDIEANTGKILRKRKIQETEIRGNSVKFYKNCVLYSKLRPYLNKVIITDFEGLGTTELVVLEPNNKILNTCFFAEYLKSPKVVNYLNADASGTKMPRTNMKLFRDLIIPIPPLEIQNQIVNEIENFNKKLETIKQLQQQTEAEITAMEKSVLNKYIQTN